LRSSGLLLVKGFRAGRVLGVLGDLRSFGWDGRETVP
jgi:hypothetical protein